jgi:hypothetical protein
MGLIGAAFGLGFVFGPDWRNLSRWASTPFLFAGGLAFANAVLLYLLCLTVTRSSARVSAATGRGWKQLFDALKQTRLAFVMTIYFLSIVAFLIMTAVFTLFARSGLDMTPGTLAGSSHLSALSRRLFRAASLKARQAFRRTAAGDCRALLFTASLFITLFVTVGVGVPGILLVGACHRLAMPDGAGAEQSGFQERARKTRAACLG